MTDTSFLQPISRPFAPLLSSNGKSGMTFPFAPPVSEDENLVSSLIENPQSGVYESSEQYEAIQRLAKSNGPSPAKDRAQVWLNRRSQLQAEIQKWISECFLEYQKNSSAEFRKSKMFDQRTFVLSVQSSVVAVQEQRPRSPSKPFQFDFKLINRNGAWLVEPSFVLSRQENGNSFHSTLTGTYFNHLMFDFVENVKKGKIEIVKMVWNKPTVGLESKNYQEFQDNKKLFQTDQQAAANTWSGRIITPHGYGVNEVRRTEADQKIVVIFTRDQAASARNKQFEAIRNRFTTSDSFLFDLNQKMKNDPELKNQIETWLRKEFGAKSVVYVKMQKLVDRFLQNRRSRDIEKVGEYIALEWLAKFGSFEDINRIRAADWISERQKQREQVKVWLYQQIQNYIKNGRPSLHKFNPKFGIELYLSADLIEVKETSFEAPVKFSANFSLYKNQWNASPYFDLLQERNSSMFHSRFLMGEDAVQLMFDFLKLTKHANIQKIGETWERTNDPNNSRMYFSFMENRKQMTDSEAAENTWSGQLYRGRGFIAKVATDNDRRKQIYVEFSRSSNVENQAGHPAPIKSDGSIVNIKEGILSFSGQLFFEKNISIVVEKYYKDIDAKKLDDVMAIFEEAAVYDRGTSHFGSKKEIDQFFRKERRLSGQHTVWEINTNGNIVSVTGQFVGNNGSKYLATRFTDQWVFEKNGLVRYRKSWIENPDAH